LKKKKKKKNRTWSGKVSLLEFDNDAFFALKCSFGLFIKVCDGGHGFVCDADERCEFIVDEIFDLMRMGIHLAHARINVTKLRPTNPVPPNTNTSGFLAEDEKKTGKNKESNQKTKTTPCNSIELKTVFDIKKTHLRPC
jgi:hypothetical protein